MKIPMLLQAAFKQQAHRKHLKLYVQIELLERGKVRTVTQTGYTGPVVGNTHKGITYFYLTEGRGTTVEAPVMGVEEQPQVNPIRNSFLFTNLLSRVGQ